MEISPDGKKPADRQRLNLSQLEDLHWHQFCVTWSGFSGVIQYYFDGKNILSAINRQRGELQGGGSLAVGDTRMRITGFDVWDRVLTRQEIAQNLKKCDAGKGNVVQWHQAFKYFRKNKKMYSIPSACEPPSSN
ncbi:hypothetical protein pdam_00016951 [Pocillopora damicornis]|uniref:Pentraxin (PTX) domain-containing protein n=2 Tax=Pocillopora damicornis TaxID=46731 RepID=A0A3M6TQF7_POCDA|nr:hypothetical protein pdam_00016951 [Pocillopora damicornis]